MGLYGYDTNAQRVSAYQNSMPSAKEDLSVGFQEGVGDLLQLIAMPFLMFGAPFRGLQIGRALLGSRAYQLFGYAKRPALSYGVHHQIQGARAAMFLSKSYSKFLIGLNMFQFNTNVALAREREYKKLGINVFGPPLSLFAYNNYMSRNSTTEDVIMAAEKESRIDASLTSASKTRGKNISYKPKQGARCAPGYRKINGMCVKQ